MNVDDPEPSADTPQSSANLSIADAYALRRNLAWNAYVEASQEYARFSAWADPRMAGGGNWEPIDGATNDPAAAMKEAWKSQTKHSSQGPQSSAGVSTDTFSRSFLEELIPDGTAKEDPSTEDTLEIIQLVTKVSSGLSDLSIAAGEEMSEELGGLGKTNPLHPMSRKSSGLSDISMGDLLPHEEEQSAYFKSQSNLGPDMATAGELISNPTLDFAGPSAVTTAAMEFSECDGKFMFHQYDPRRHTFKTDL